MKPIRWMAVVWASLLLVLAADSTAQQRAVSPRIAYVYPAGGQRGTSFEVTVGGQLLGTSNGALFSGQGVHAEVAGYDRPLTQREVLLLRDRLEEARKKLQGDAPAAPPRPGLRNPFALAMLAKEAGITDEQLRKLAEFQRDRANPKKQPNPQIEEKVTLKVQIDADARCGTRDLRLLTLGGVTNPIRFEVGETTECRETEPNDRALSSETGNALPVTINGQILPGDVDSFSFTAKKGMQIVASVHARVLVPYLADAVPGWFQPAAAIYDAKGRELAYADHFRFNPDPVLFCRIPEDGTYVLQVRDTLYRGREDFVYRVTVGEIPFITSAFPLGVQAGTVQPVAVKGWNLPAGTVPVEGKTSGTVLTTVRAGGLESNQVPLAIDTLPECAEKEPNEGPTRAQRVSPPVVINGYIDRPGDEDVYRFEGKADSEIVAEVFARRLESPVDSALTLTDSRGRAIAVNDDCEDKSCGLLTHHADSRIVAKLPATGTYYLTLRDAQGKGGGDYGYRLRIGQPQPDFELRVVPSNITVRAGGAVSVTVYILRKDGFGGEVALEIKNAPPGFTLNGGRIPTGQEKVSVTITAPPAGRPMPFSLRLEGRTVVAGKEIRHTATPADDMMQAFAYHHLVPAEEWLVSVIGRAPLRRR